MQLKTEIKSYFPATELAGVFITAAGIFLSYILTARQAGIEPVYQYLVFFTTLCFYSTDHFFDILKYSRRENLSVWYRKIYLTVSISSGIAALFAYAVLWPERRVLMDFLPAVISALAYVFFFRRMGIIFLFLRLILVAITAAFVVNSGTLTGGDIVRYDLQYFCMVFLVMLMNVVVSMQLDQSKDQYLRNRNLFSLMSRKNVVQLRHWVAAMIVIISVVLAIYSGKSAIGAGVVLYTSLMVLVANFSAKLPYGLYRILPDILLPLAFLPLW